MAEVDTLGHRALRVTDSFGEPFILALVVR